MRILGGMLVMVVIAVAAPSVQGGEIHSVNWSLGNDYSSWATKVINVGDTIVFNYDSSSHSLLVVDQSDYSNCISSNAIQSNSNGKTSIKLTKPGPMYFICGSPGHCPRMQLQINVRASKNPSSSSSPSLVSPSTPGSSHPSSSSNGAAAANSSNMSDLIFGLFVAFGTMFAFVG
ncbi:hypothetical protein Dimus_024383 [Dionaea muscipula]